MGHIYFVRHGQTIWNVENKICGATDIVLTELGHEQAKEAGREILRQGLKIDEILYSPLIRASETARHISEITGIPAREEIRLKEQNFGKYESTPRDGAEFYEAKKNFICRYEGGESMFQVAQRLYNLLDDLKKDAASHAFNPFLLDVREPLDEKRLAQIREGAVQTINRCIGGAIAAYELLDLYHMKPIIDNVLYFGLQRTVKGIAVGKRTIPEHEMEIN